MLQSLGKILRALSVLFVSLGVFIIAIPLSRVLGTHTVPGVHEGNMGWPSWIHSALIFVFIGAVLFCVHLFSRSQKQGLLASVLLWGATLAGGAFGAFVIYEMLRVIVGY
jgi:hypothetical protein